METTEKLSIIVPTYRRPQLLSQCLASIAEQSFRDFVVLVCDNSPSREAEKVVQELRDERFRYVPRQRNLGILANVLGGFQAARTPYVMEVDDDDRLLPGALHDLMQPLLADATLKLAFGELEVVDVDGHVLSGVDRTYFIPEPHHLAPGRHEDLMRVAVQGRLYMMSSVIRREAVDWGAIPARVATAYDRLIAMTVARDGGACFYVARPLVAYRVHSTSDGLRHESAQLAGALEALRLEQDRSCGLMRDVIDGEIVRTTFMLSRALLEETRVMRAVSVFLRLLRPRSMRLMGSLLRTEYLPRRLQRTRGGLRTRNLHRRRIR